MKLSKNVNNKKCAPKLIFFNEKKIEKDSDNFWHRKLTLKVKRLGDFALFDTSPLTQFWKFNNFLWVCWFWGKNLSNFAHPVWKLHNPYCHIGHCLNKINLLIHAFFSIPVAKKSNVDFQTDFWARYVCQNYHPLFFQYLWQKNSNGWLSNGLFSTLCLSEISLTPFRNVCQVPSLNTQSCIRGLLKVRDFCFLAV